MCGTYLFGLLNVSQAGLEPVAAAAVVVAALKFSQCNVLWESFFFFFFFCFRVSKVCLGLGRLFPLDEGGEENERKKNSCGERGFPQGWTHLAGWAVGGSS
jgi:hypothetical protein